MSGVKERISQFIKANHMTTVDFEKSIGVSNGYISSISKSIQPDKLGIISDTYPDLSIEWLLVGKGEMLKSSSTGGKSMNTSIHGDFSKPIFADIKNTMGDTVIGHNAQNKSNNNIQTSSNEELLRAKMEIEYLQKENEKLNVSLERAIADKERAMAMLEKILNK